ncbi:unnamed protein product [Anisakis simplex]|uniref:PID domain-containing protein n=1 Tax=Anisakis simplex TaxID=6269 RepID=A0A0M3KGS7_ANISI|nr:unnamed protein product [Anisakis simplex]
MENTHLSSHNDENMYGNSSDDVLCDKDEHHFKDDTTSSIQYQSSPSNHSTSSSPFFSFPFLKRRQSYTINPPDDTYNVTYLGNVLTVMAKETKQQGLTEYWAHRITFCLAPPDYPRLFCWVYKHEGKRMKPELRCHAVLCKKTSEPNAITLKLHEFLQAALQEYRREKLSMQNARLNATVIGKAGTCPKRYFSLSIFKTLQSDGRS